MSRHSIKSKSWIWIYQIHKKWILLGPCLNPSLNALHPDNPGQKRQGCYWLSFNTTEEWVECWMKCIREHVSRAAVACRAHSGTAPGLYVLYDDCSSSASMRVCIRRVFGPWFGYESQVRCTTDCAPRSGWFILSETLGHDTTSLPQARTLGK